MNQSFTLSGFRETQLLMKPWNIFILRIVFFLNFHGTSIRHLSKDDYTMMTMIKEGGLWHRESLMPMIKEKQTQQMETMQDSFSLLSSPSRKGHDKQ